MATPPFGVALEANLKARTQGGKLYLALGITVDPQFHCCLSGASVEIAKDPVAKLSVSPGSACTGNAVNADYSNSFSPTSTLVTWSIAWGDGQTSGGAWPGAGNVNHPLGGYVLPGHYQITLTVWDQLGAVGTESATHVALDCSSGIPVEVLGGCGASGPFHSSNGGFTWTNIGGGVLDAATVYDLKATWFSWALTIQEVWAATSLGLYKGELNIDTHAVSWEEITTLGAGLTARAIAHSKYVADEVYILANDGGGTPYLYRTEDGGLTWTNIQLGPIEWQAVGAIGTNILGRCLAWNSVRDEMFVGCTGLNMGTCPGYPWPPFTTTTLRWNGAVWDTMLEGVGEDGTEDLAMDNVTGRLFMAGGYDWQCLVPATDFAMWDSVNNSYTFYPPPYAVLYTNAIEIHRGLVWWYGEGILGTNDDILVRRGNSWVGAGNANGSVREMTSNIHHLYAGGSFTTIDGATMRRLARITDPEAVWGEVGGGIRNGTVYAIAFDADGHLLVGGSFTNAAGHSIRYMARWLGGYNWVQMGEGDEALNNFVFDIKVASNGTIYISGQFTATVGGRTLNRVARWDALNEAWRPVGVSGFNLSAWGLEWDGDHRLWATGSFTTADGNAVEGVARLEAGTATIPTVGRTHLIDMDANGEYVYVALLDSSNDPFVLRVAYDLATIDGVYTPGAGTWGGVACDPYYPSKVWLFGDFGAATKVLYSDDWAESFTDVTDGGWAAGEIVRPLLISEHSSQDVVAVLNNALQTWQTKDDGTTWANNGAIAFACQCGVRDPLEPLNIWIGRAAAGAAHIRYSPNVGDDWLEWSTGFEANAPVAALQVIG